MTLKEIAAQAGVSPAAVSLVLHNKPGVGEVKRREILALLQKNNFIPANHPVLVPKRNLLFLKYIKNGFLVEENTGFIATIMDAVEAECRKNGYSLNIIVSNNNLEQTIGEIDFSSFSGVFVLGTELDFSSYPLLKGIPIPYIVIDNIMPHFVCNAITMDNHEMVYDAVKHLASLGFSETGYLKSRMKIQNFEDRSASFHQTVREFNMHCAPEHVFMLEPTMLGAYASMKQYLAKGTDIPPCMFADNDVIAIGAIKALKEYKYKIPEDVCIIGFDDIRFAAVNSPSLSTMRVPKNLIGYLAVKILNDALKNNALQNCKIQVCGELIIRRSTLLEQK